MVTSLKKVAVFLKKYSIGKSSPVVCMLDILSDNYEVDFFIQNASNSKATVLNKKTINLIEIENRKKINLFNTINQTLVYLIGNSINKKEKIKIVLIKIKKTFVSLIRAVLKKNNKIDYNNNYTCYICFDPHGYFLCKELFPNARPFYYSLELYFKDNYFNLEYPEEVMNKERSEINTIKGLIIQSREREMLFREEYALSDQVPTLFLPVTYLQPSSAEKSFMFRGKYNINDGKKIALHLGGIQEYHSCIELALAFSSINDWVLIFHGYYFGDYINKLRTALKRNKIKNVIISEDAFELIEDMDTILMSSDIGICWYNNVSPNLATSGKSSGKISAYLRFGLPVIVNKYNCTIEAIEQTGCGVCVDDFSEIKDAVLKIEKNYDRYSSNCRKEYDMVYWFENYKAPILEFIRQ